MMHIMHVLFSLGTSGLQKQVVNVINRADRARFRHSVCCLEYIGPYADLLEHPRPPIHLMNKKPGLSPLLPARLAWLFWRERVDVVHSRGVGTFLYSALPARAAGASFIYGEHGDLPQLQHKRRLRAALRTLEPLVDQMYAVTESGRRCAADVTRRPIHRISVLHNGVESDLYRPGDAATPRTRIGIDPAAFVIAFLGRVAPVKNLDALFSALPAVYAAVPNAALVIIGDGPDMLKVRALAAAAPAPDSVHLLGERHDVPDLLPALSVVVLPSWTEGHSNTLLEAMSAGLPVIASRVGGNVETVREGQTGLLFSPDRPAELAEHIVRLAHSPDLAHGMGENARRVILAEYSIDAMVRRYEALYERAARRKADTCPAP